MSLVVTPAWSLWATYANVPAAILPATRILAISSAPWMTMAMQLPNRRPRGRQLGPVNSRLLRYQRVGDTSEHGSDDRGQPEQPELFERPTAHEQGRTGAARGIDREVGDRN